MSTDLLEAQSRQHFQPIDHWFWPTSSLLSPLMETNKSQAQSQSVSQNCQSVSTTVSTSGQTYHRRHKHWWKVCWIYNNGHFIGTPSKTNHLRQFHQQFSSFSMCSSNMSAIFNDRCVKRDESQIFAAKPNVSPNGPPVISSDQCSRGHDLGRGDHLSSGQSLPPVVTSRAVDPLGPMSVCAAHIGSSATSGFLSQKLTQPLSALLKQRSEHKNSSQSISQFFIDFKGSDWRADQLQYQMPAQDIQMFKSQSIEVKFVRNQQRKAQIKPQLFLNKAVTQCFKCKQAIEVDAYVVKISVSKNGNHNNGYNTTTDDEDSAVVKDSGSEGSHPSLNGSTALFHIDCFTCEECQQVLVDLKAFLHTNIDRNDRSVVKNNLYCSRHFVELYKPRCQFCDHLIFDEECTEAEGKAWHLGHFCCSECKRSLGGQQYIMADPSKQNDKKSDAIRDRLQTPTNPRDKKQLPYCLTCFDILFGELCEECGELIGCDVGAITHEGRSWHASDLCFKCNLCSKTLLGKPFLPAFDGKIYCSITCSQEAIQRNRYRNRRKVKAVANGNTDTTAQNDLPKNCQRIEPQRPKQETKLQNHHNYCHRPPLASERIIGQPMSRAVSHSDGTKQPIVSPRVNTQSAGSDVSDGISKKISEMQLNQTTNICDLKTPQTNDCIIPMESHPKAIRNSSPNLEQNSSNSLLNRQMFEYLQHCQQSGRAPTHVMDFMRQQLIQNEINGHNGIIGASIEYMSEDERTNPSAVDHKNHIVNDINYNQMTPMTSSTSSSLNANHSESLNNSNISNALKCKPLLTHSSSSNETTPLLLRSLENRAKQLTQMQTNSRQVMESRAMAERQVPSLSSLMKSESPSQTSSQADQSSNSSYIENNHRINDSMFVNSMSVHNMKAVEGKDSPSTQSTALQSTSSQTTPESNPRLTNKSVSFDPNVKEPTGRRLNRKPKPRPKRSEWSDTQSCSTCSTCSSSSSSSDDDYETSLDRSRKEWLGGTKIQYVSSDRKRNVTTNVMTQNGSQNNESCIIS